MISSLVGGFKTRLYVGTNSSSRKVPTFQSKPSQKTKTNNKKSHHMFFVNKVFWNTVTLISLHIVYSWFHTTECSNYRNLIACKTENIYLALGRTNLLIPVLTDDSYNKG